MPGIIGGGLSDDVRSVRALRRCKQASKIDRDRRARGIRPGFCGGLIMQNNLTPEDIKALENLLFFAMVSYARLPDDGPEQDYIMSSAIGPAREALQKLQGA